MMLRLVGNRALTSHYDPRIQPSLRDSFIVAAHPMLKHWAICICPFGTDAWSRKLTLQSQTWRLLQKLSSAAGVAFRSVPKGTVENSPRFLTLGFIGRRDESRRDG